jgi:hypothetical protein
MIAAMGAMLILSACGNSASPDLADGGSTAALAACGPGSLPEGSIQGEVPLSDRQSGRSKQGYRCNLELLGQYQGEGASWVNPSTANCAYMATSFYGTLTKKSPGVQVVDVSNPARPALSGTLTSPAMLIGPWESLKVNESRHLLGAVAGGPLVAAGYFDVYSLSGGCTRPQRLNDIAGTPLQLPADVLGHEGNWSPDGRTYWSSGLIGGSLTAIDVSNPQSPAIIWSGIAAFPVNHGVELSEDGNTLYLATVFPGGVLILDVSDIQQRKPVPAVRTIGQVTWDSQSVGQHAFPVSYSGKPYLIAADEFNAEGVHIVDISNPAAPVVVRHLQLQIQLPQYAAARAADTAGDGLFGYEAHYCAVDRPVNPTALACGFFESGIRVFDIRDPLNPREIAYFNPPAQTGRFLQLAGSEHAAGLALVPAASNLSGDVELGAGDYAVNLLHGNDANLSADWCSSPPRFVAPDQLWVTCQDNGFMVLRFTNGVYPVQ